MKKMMLAGAFALLMTSGASYAQDASVTKVTTDQYVATAASSDMFEIQSSKMALEMSKSAGVKEFAEHMVSDHSTTTKELMAAAKAENITVPTTMMPKHAAMVEQLQAADAASFDTLYLQMQVTAHQEAVALHTAYAKNGEDAALMAVAEKAVPIVTEHYEDVQALAKKS